MQVEDYMIIGYEMSGQFKRFLGTKLCATHNHHHTRRVNHDENMPGSPRFTLCATQCLGDGLRLEHINRCIFIEMQGEHTFWKNTKPFFLLFISFILILFAIHPLKLSPRTP